MNLKHPRVLSKYLASRVTLVRNYCKKCGRAAEPFDVPDGVWQSVVGDGRRDERCIRCFTSEARDCGVHVEWQYQRP